VSLVRALAWPGWRPVVAGPPLPVTRSPRRAQL